MENLSSVESVQAEIEHTCDGPLTPFVLIYRSMELVQRQRANARMASDALYSALSERGWIVDGNTLGDSCGS